MGKRRVRREFSADFKPRIVEQSYAAGTSVSVVERRHDINANVLADGAMIRDMRLKNKAFYRSRSAR